MQIGDSIRLVREISPDSLRLQSDIVQALVREGEGKVLAVIKRGTIVPFILLVQTATGVQGYVPQDWCGPVYLPAKEEPKEPRLNVRKLRLLD